MTTREIMQALKEAIADHQSMGEYFPEPQAFAARAKVQKYANMLAREMGGKFFS